jgi:hypothetical protein
MSDQWWQFGRQSTFRTGCLPYPQPIRAGRTSGRVDEPITPAYDAARAHGQHLAAKSAHSVLSIHLLMK